MTIMMQPDAVRGNWTAVVGEDWASLLRPELWPPAATAVAQRSGAALSLSTVGLQGLLSQLRNGSQSLLQQCSAQFSSAQHFTSVSASCQSLPEHIIQTSLYHRVPVSAGRWATGRLQLRTDCMFLAIEMCPEGRLISLHNQFYRWD